MSTNQRSDEIAQKVVELEAKLVGIARFAGVPFWDSVNGDSGDCGQGDRIPSVRVELARHGTEWGLWAYEDGEDKAPKRLSDASLFLREEFLDDSVSFVEHFLGLVAGHGQRQEQALAEADQALSLLRDFK